VIDLVGTNVRIKWTKPTTNGDDIITYQIVMRGLDTNFYANSYCDGSI